LDALDKILQRCETRGLSIKLSKCVFAASEIPVLGDFVGRRGVRMDPDKITIFKNWPVPKTTKELKSFLGTIVYCARFCADYGKLATPLQNALEGKRKNEVLCLKDEEIQAFHLLVQAMCETPVLALPDFSKNFSIRMDASDFAIGGVLYQLDDLGEERPIAYTGRKLKKAELNYPVREKELLAIIHALQTWRPYLLDKAFTVETDHKSLQELLTQRTCTQRLARWLNFISQYKPMFKWIPGITNTLADGISRRVDFEPPDGHASCINLQELLKSILEGNDPLGDDAIDDQAITFQNFDQAMLIYHTMRPFDVRLMCQQNYPKDPYFAPIWKFLLQGGKNSTTPIVNHFQIRNRLLWYLKKKDDLPRLCLPANPELKNILLFNEHDSPSKGHPGVYKTVNFMTRKYYWPNMVKSIRKYIKSCEKCQRNKFSQTKPPGQLQPLPIPETRWQHITMDFITDLPKSHGFNSIWVIIDRLTKRGHFISMKMGEGDSSAKECAIIFCKEYQKLHGIPETIISDRDVRFTSDFWQELMRLQGCTHMLSSAFRPNTDGQTERTNRFIEDYLRNYVYPCQSNWSELLWTAEYAYNARIHESIKMAPFEADIGYIPRAVSDHQFDKIVGNHSIEQAYDFGRRQQEILSRAKESLVLAQSRMKLYYDKNRPIQLFEVGDKVMISSKNLNIENLGVKAGSTRKFAPLWIGPYSICQKVSIDTYKLKLPTGLRLHPDFHTSLLKKPVTVKRYFDHP